MLFASPDVATVFGLLGVISGSLWGLLRSTRSIVAVQALCTGSFALHYLLLGAHTGAAMNALTLVQVAVVLCLRRGRISSLAYWSTIPVMGALTLYTWAGAPSVFAALGLTTASLGRWQTEVLRLRIFFVACSLCWFAHNAIVGSSFGMATDTISLASNMWGLWRHLKRSVPDERVSTAS